MDSSNEKLQLFNFIGLSINVYALRGHSAWLEGKTTSQSQKA